MTQSQVWNSSKYAKDAEFVSRLGLPVVDLLAPQRGEHILDLGCGDGTLAQHLVEYGCHIVGVDASDSMIDAAKSKGIEAYVKSGEELNYQQEFDAVFSNAALHWMTNSDAVIAGVAQSLKTGGRFVAEMGGYGNIAAIREAIETVFNNHPEYGSYQSPWYFPSPQQYEKQLLSHGFKVEYIELIPRPTPVQSGIIEWLKIFAAHAIGHLTPTQQQVFFGEVESLVKTKLYSEQEGWVADYVRLRFKAIKTA
ncbi:methyltransferase domain-containing protein [Vibrio sp. CAIM 722]|uniref:Methyltransferase domain-containing protein n=1 Tax=Vibrio eleionomae TaxID=2653505 RepID=A0A7X4RW71_9VIBR|nr:class I SAM-dependent methyltransferase [Vibrio eleionomae]MZI95333.1 methyltransferase domain-containing protein [Vibrio eleionomae]